MVELTQTITAKVVALTVILLVIVTTAIPVILDAQNGITEEMNNTGYTYSVASSGDDSITIVIDSGTITVNGVSVTYPQYAIFATSETLQINTKASSATSLAALYYDEIADEFAELSVVKVVWSAGDVTLTKTDESTVTIEDVGDFFYIFNDGDYCLFSGTYSGAYFDKDATIYITARNSGSPSLMGVLKYVGGTYTNNLYVSGNLATSFEVSGLTTTDLGYKISSATMTASDGETTATASNTQTFVIVPLKYTIIDTSDSSYILIGLVPLLLILAAVMFAVRMLNGSRN